MKKMRISGAASVRSVILHIANLRDPACRKGKKVPSLLCIALRASSHIFQYGGTKACTVPISCQLTLSCAPTDKQMVRPFFMSANQWPKACRPLPLHMLPGFSTRVLPGRYSRPFKKPAERTYPICKIEMEDQYHFLNICPAYQEKRCSLLDFLEKVYRIKISRMSPNRIFMFLINPPSRNVRIQKVN